MQGIEEQVVDLFLTNEHLFLLIGIFAIILLLKWMGPVKRFLFSEKWKWLIAPLNVGLSFVGIFVLGLTTLTSTNMKIIVALVASAIVTFTYEAVAKYVVDFLSNIIKKKFAKEA